MKHVKSLLINLLKRIEEMERRKRMPKKKVSIFEREVKVPLAVIILMNFFLFYFSLLLVFGFETVKILTIFLILLITFIGFGIYFKSTFKEILENNEAMTLLGLLTFVYTGGILYFSTYKGVTPYLIPISSAVMLLALLLNRQIAIDIGVILSIFCFLLYDFNFNCMMFHLLISLFAAFFIQKAVHRSDILKAGIKLTFLIIVLVIGLENISQTKFTMPTKAIWQGAVNGIVSTMIVFTFLMPLESFFSRITNITLIELADFNQPLLKRLMLEAPGTYHHSLLVASLAEKSAEIVGANPILARVSAYYHDIGKLVKPQYFIENQAGLGNPHDSLSPSMSGMIVISHVKEGIALAKEFNLNKTIIDLIRQHHGTSLQQLFYKEAKEGSAAEEEKFRYPGPKPRTKESAILMICDFCEAAVRALRMPTPQKIRTTVEKTINNKFIDGQFNEAPLTLVDLYRIAETIISTLTSIYHSRVSYP